MSQENVEASRKVWSRFLTDDIPGTLGFFDAEIEVHDVPSLPDASVYHGHQGWLDQIAKFRESFSEMTYEPLEFIDAGDKVVDVIRVTGVARVTGIEGEATVAQVDTWHHRKIVVIEYFLSKADALEAAGISE